MEHLLPWLRLQYTPGLGRVGLMRLIEYFGSAELALENASRRWPYLQGLRKGLETFVPPENDQIVKQAAQTLAKMKARLHTFWDQDYPCYLKQISDPPAIFYSCGVLPDLPGLAIVGARQASHFGKHFTEQLAAEIAATGIHIVSGLARGIDTAAHRGAIKAGGSTVAVLGCGIDRVYPSENKQLYQQITEQGALVSEYPPGSAPMAGHFPGRNRIISAMSRATLVVEASLDSGSLITAEFALEQGRDVMAVPGGVDRNNSAGPNLLIKQGAHPVTEAADVLSILGLSTVPASSEQRNNGPPEGLSAPLAKILAFLDLTPRHSDELVGQSGLTPMELSAILLHLELQGHAKKLPGGRYIRTF
jgi:DNA processing protein